MTPFRMAVAVIFIPLCCVYGQSTHERAQGLLNDSLKDKNPDTRMEGVQSLSLVAAREPYLNQVEGMLDDKDEQVRVAAIASLVDLRNRSAIGALKNALNDDAPEVSFAAAKALWMLKDPAGETALLSVLSGDTKTASGFVSKQKRDALRMFHTPKTLLTFAMIQGIGMAPVPGIGAGVSSLRGILSNPGVSGRAATALLLSGDRNPAVQQALIDALSDKDASVRAAAADAVALRNNTALAPDLVPLMDDKEDAVRLRAAAGWLRLEAIRKTPRKVVAKAGAK